MSKKLKLYATFFVFIINSYFISESTAYLIHSDSAAMGRHGGHEEITGWSIDGLKYGAALKGSLNDFRASITKGATEEDEGFLGIQWKTIYHFYPKAATRGQGLYDKARDMYRAGDRAGGWEKLGHVLHLAQDMTAPSHANDAWHKWHYFNQMGYEWWVAANWNTKIEPVLRDFFAINNNSEAGFGSAWSYIAYAGQQTQLSGYDFDKDGADYSTRKIVLPSVAAEIAYRQVPLAIRASGGIFNMFWREVGSGGPVPPNDNLYSAPTVGHPDDNFDVSTRLIKLEELDPTKQLWKDLYSRTGIKKGYIELYLSKALNQANKKLKDSKTEDEFNQNFHHFQSTLNATTNAATYDFEETYFNSPDLVLLSRGFVDNTAELLIKRLKEPIREVNDSFNPKIVSSQPVMVIPSAGFSGMEDSAFLKASLDEYVKNGGTLIVFTQQHGYEFSILPVPQEPDGSYRLVGGYGWEEDQNCFTNGTYIDTWHQMLSSQSRSTPTMNVDGYFTSYPSNATVLLRRTANGQPAMIMYEYGQGRVIATTMYSDWAYGHGQASSEEIALVNDMISWAKKPETLTELKRGDIASFTMTVQNISATDAASVKLQFYNPDRSALLYELPVYTAVLASQSASVGAYYWTNSATPLGICHVDYLLFDAQGNVIQPQAEADSGRFIVSSPPQTGTPDKDIWFSISTTSQSVFYGAAFDYTFHVFNNTNETRNLTIKTLLPHTNRRKEWTITASPNAETSVSGSDLFLDTRWMFETLRAYLYDENGVEIANYMLSFKGTYPSVNVTAKTDRSLYKRGDTVNLALNLQNRQTSGFAATVKVRVTDASNSSIYDTSFEANLSASGESVQNLSFALPESAQGGFYAVLTEVFEANGKKIGGTSASFELPLSRIAVTPVFPAVYSVGNNTISFTINNTGKIPVSSGSLDITLRDPDGQVVSTVSQPFSLQPVESIEQSVNITVPALKFGTYTLAYSQSDETKTGKPTVVSIPNTIAASVSMDKTSYRIRETANVSLGLTNTGKFNLEGMAFTAAVPDANYSDARSISLAVNANATADYAIPLPQTMTSGQHDVTVTFALPSGSSTVQNSTLTVPESSISLALDQTNYSAGSTISPVFTNTGGVDTPVEYKLSLYDSKSALINEKSATETVQAGSSLPLSLSIPSGATDGSYNIVINYKNTGTGKADIIRKPLAIAGVKGALAVKTDKQAYLISEDISSLSTITNLGTAIENGNLHLQVTTSGGNQIVKTWTSQYDFQQSTRTGVDTYESPDNITLLQLADNFDDGILNTDRWMPGVTTSGAQPVEQNGTLKLYLPPCSRNCTSYTYHKETASGDFTTTVDYKIDGAWNRWGNNHAPNFLVLRPDWSWYMWIDVWGYGPYYGTMDSYGQYANAGGAALQGKLKISRVGSNIMCYYWNGSGWILLKTYYNRTTAPLSFRLLAGGDRGNVSTLFDNFVVTTQKYNSSGTIYLQFDSGRSETWGNLSFNAETPNGTSIKFRTRTADTQAGLSNAPWSSYITISESPIASPKARWIQVEATLETSDTNVTPILHDLSVTQGHKPGDVLWQTDALINLVDNATLDLTNAVDTPVVEGKFYLQGTLTSGTGQTIATSEYPFYIVEGNTALLFTTDKKVYRPGETVTVTGEVRNLTSIESSDIELGVRREAGGETPETLYAETFSVPAGGSHPFTFTATAGAEGAVTLTGTVIQNNSTLVEIADRYEVANPAVTATVTAPEVVGNEPFTMNVEFWNTGKVEAEVQFGVQGSEFGDAGTLTIPAGETNLVRHDQQITSSATYTFTFAGDLNQAIAKTVSYGLAAAIQFGAQGSKSVKPEGKIAIPVTITNTGQLEETIAAGFKLQSSASAVISEQTKTYFIPEGGSVTDTLYYDLTEGEYQFKALSSSPTATAGLTLSVLKENMIDMTLTVGEQENELIPAAVTVSNLGYNTINGTIQGAVVNGEGTAVWSGEQAVDQLATGNSRSVTFNINPAGIVPGAYTFKAELFDNGGQMLTVRNSSLIVRGAVIELTQAPDYQTFNAGQEASFIFKVANTGNQEGPAGLSFKAYDLIDSTRTEWLKPGEEKEIAFSFLLPDDLEEKDYFGDFEVKTGSNQQAVSSGQVKYHVAGIKIGVDASLDQQNYREGETARLTLQITDDREQKTDINLFARVNYNGYEEQSPFILNGPRTLIFDVPLAQITGEKLFYGIYHNGGRSIHLNNIYIYKADDALSITADKQVYEPGETISASISSSGLAGEMTLTGPGGYSETFEFTGLVSRSIVLPSTMTAGTYPINAELKTQNSELLTASHAIDVRGIQVKVTEARLDKAKYSSNDTLKLTLTISSNRDMSAVLRTWVVDPTGTYTEAGESAVTLTASEPLLATQNSTLRTELSGIHRLVYGIYVGDILLSSGSEAFDVGEAVLFGVSTDKASYATATEPVTANVSMFGTIGADLELQIDGQPVRTESVSLNGFVTSSYELSAITPGPHTLQAVLTSGGLSSTKETTFVYGGDLPDLITDIRAQTTDITPENTMQITATVMNQGKDASAATTVSIYDGDPSTGAGQAITSIPVRALNGGEYETVSFNWSVLGQAGEHTLRAVIDPDNAVLEFNESNNTGITRIVVPDLIVHAGTDKDIYKIRQKVYITAAVTNLTSGQTFADLSLLTTAKDSAGTGAYSQTADLGSLGPGASTTSSGVWNTTGLAVDGAYTISQEVTAAGGASAQGTKLITLEKAPDFTLNAEVTSNRVKQGETATYTVTLAPISGWTHETSLSLEGLPTGASASFDPDKLLLPGQAQTLVVTTDTTPVGTHTLYVTAQGSDEGEIVSHTVQLTLDVAGYGLETGTETRTIKQLETATYPVNLTSLNGYEGSVSLSVSGLPNGTKATLDNAQLEAPGAATLTVRTSKYAKPGTYAVTITGNDGLASHSLNLSLVLQQNPDIAAGIIAAPGPGPRNPAMVRLYSADKQLINEFTGFRSRYGANAVSADIDGDGYDEIIVAQGPGPKNKATLRAFKRDGTLLGEYTAFKGRYGLALAAGDFDGDWKDEIVIGAGAGPGSPSRVMIAKYDGARFIRTGVDFHAFAGTGHHDDEENEHGYGVNIAAGDLDGDHAPELIVAPGPGPKSPAVVRTYRVDVSQGTGQWKIAATHSEFTAFTRHEAEGRHDKGDDRERKPAHYGVHVAAGDTDGDGIDEIIAGAGPGPDNISLVKVFKGDGTFAGLAFIAYPEKRGHKHGDANDDNDDRRDKRSTGHKEKASSDDDDDDDDSHNQKYRYGVYATSADLDADGINEIITGPGPGPRNKPLVKVFKADGTEIGNFNAYPEDDKYGVKVSGGNVESSY